MKIRVLLVEDSAVVRRALEYIIGSDPRLEVAASVATAEEALQVLDGVSPDVVSLDIRLPGMDGFEATRQIMRRKPTPIVLVSAGLDSYELDVTMHALQAGALAAVEKPVSQGQAGFDELATRLCTQLAIMSDVRVVRQRPWTEAPTLPPMSAKPGGVPFRALGIAVSTGGPPALAELLPALGRAFPLPVLLVQHIGPSFVPGFCSWLRTISPLRVDMVRDRMPASPGTIYVGAPDRHLILDGTSVCASDSAPLGGHRPSATMMFRSLAGSYRNQAIGVLLTGMGTDGAAGLLELRSAGGYTITENESTAVVYGMPAEGARIGAACVTLPLPAIAPRILELVAQLTMP
jgi:two-component system, chemotaxis family, protein-glutamate methylesterase/glutaminase